MGKTLVYLEGNIGAGKTTCGRKFAANCPSCEFRPEEPEKWGRRLQDWDEDPCGVNAARLQLKALEDAFHRCFEPSEAKCLVVERSLAANRVFYDRLKNKMDKLARDIYETDYKTYIDMLDASVHKERKVMTFFIDTDPELCHDRVFCRNRPGESGVTLTYLRELHALFRERFPPSESVFYFTPV